MTHLSWAVLVRALTGEAGARRHPLDDPLDAPEWRGLAWIFERPRRTPWRRAPRCEPAAAGLR